MLKDQPNESLASLKPRASQWTKKNAKNLERLRKSKDLDPLIHQAHEDAFNRIQCLTCANCCKTTGPLFTKRDIERLSKHLQMTSRQFVDQFLRQDEDGDMVLQQVPCPFLGENNECGVYSRRPKACQEYPHTDRKQQSQIFHLTLKNAEICPAVFDVLQNISISLETDRLTNKKHK